MATAASPFCAAPDTPALTMRCWHSHDELFGERLKSPLVHAMCGKEQVAWDNPYDVGILTMLE
jgi:hypothetical protein